MHHAIVQDLIVAVVVVTAMAYAALKLMPAAWRRAFAAGAASVATRSGLSDVFARRVEAKLATGGACGSCDSCKACATPAKEEATAMSYRTIPIRRAS